MTISAKEVQELRKISGAGMMECKSALSETNGDVKEAFKVLREKGIAKAEKKSSRDANEGLIGVKIKDDRASIIEVNSETDFVSRNAEFHKLVNAVLDITMSNHDNKENLSELCSELISESVGKIGENLVLRRSDSLKGNIYSYIHNSVSPGLGKIGVLLSLDSEIMDLEEIGKNICMHIAALNPKSISKEDLSHELIMSEREILKQQLKDTGKPDNILEKMMEGKLNKFFQENTLLGQPFVIDPTINVEEYLDQSSKDLKSNISIKDFIRFEVGS